MDKNKLWKWLLLGFLLISSLTLIYPPTDVKNDQGHVVKKGKIKLGLDLKGGSSFTVQVDVDDLKKRMVDEDPDITSVDQLKASDVEKRIKVVQQVAVVMIRNRIDVLGIAEPEIYPEGDKRIVVRLPGADAATRANAKFQIMRDGVLNFKLVDTHSQEWVNELMEQGKVPPGFKYAGQDASGPYYVRDREAMSDQEMTHDFYEKLKGFGGKYADFMLRKDRFKDGSTIYRPEYIEPRPQMSGQNIKNAAVRYDQVGQPYIGLEFNKTGAKTFGQVTAANVKRQMAIILDDTLYSSPTIQDAIYGGNAQITGGFSVTEARQIVNVLRAGALPGRVKIIEERTVAPTLGRDSIHSGLMAILWGGVAVLVFMGFYYLIPGLIADFSLIFVLLLLPVGMMISAGFLGVISGSLEGGSVSLPTLTLYGIAGIVLTVGMAVDANVLTFERMREEWRVGKSISGAINAGYNKAFSTILDANVTTLLTAIILFWQGSGPIRGFAVTLSAGILVSMFIVLVITRLFFNTLADGGLLKSVKMLGIPFLLNAKFNFVGARKYAAVFSLALIIGSWAWFIKKGSDNFGVDFTGGSVITFNFDQKQGQEAVSAALAKAGFPAAKVSYQSDLSGHQTLEVKVGASDSDVDPVVAAVKKLPGNYNDINISSVGSQIGSELKKKGTMALLWSFVGIIIYISIRFEFSFAMGAIIALVHDVLITIGVFCLLGHELSMPIIAALLTIVGYSVNDTIVVFDRIREDLKLVKGKSYSEIANLSINQTLSRTVLTSFTTLLTIFVLLLVGGGAVYDFALTLFIGIVIGTYSSIFVATPVVLLWHKDDKVPQ